jgi:HK97 family phage portal protein
MGLFAGPKTLDGRPAQTIRQLLGTGGGSTGMWGISSPMDLIPTRPFQKLGPTVTQDTAMRSSAVWAALRLRAGLISTLPIDAFRVVNGQQVQVASRPPILSAPGGPKVDITEYWYSSSVDLNRAGNHIAIIAETNGYGLPAYLEAQPSNECAVVVKGGKLWKYRIAGKLYDPDTIWHEKAYTSSGLYVGLSPVAYAAWAIGEYLNVQEFATNWFAQMGIPRARLGNKAKTITQTEASIVKESWRASISAGEPFVHGSDWDYEMIQAQQASADWLEAKAFGITDVARFFDVPAELIDATPTGARNARGNLVYANIGQYNAQFLTMHLGPEIVRRERAWTTLLPQGQFVKVRTNALMRMDPATLAQVNAILIQSRQMAPSEARALNNLLPFTSDQIMEFDHFWPPTGNVEGQGPPPVGEGSDFDPNLDLLDLTSAGAAGASGQLASRAAHPALTSGRSWDL